MVHGTNANCSVKQQDPMRERSGEGELGKWENKTKRIGVIGVIETRR